MGTRLPGLDNPMRHAKGGLRALPWLLSNRSRLQSPALDVTNSGIEMAGPLIQRVITSLALCASSLPSPSLELLREGSASSHPDGGQRSTTSLASSAPLQHELVGKTLCFHSVLAHARQHTNMDMAVIVIVTDEQATLSQMLLTSDHVRGDVGGAGGGGGADAMALNSVTLDDLQRLNGLGHGRRW